MKFPNGFCRLNFALGVSHLSECRRRGLTVSNRFTVMELHRCEWTASAYLERCGTLIPWRGKMRVHCE